MADVMGVQEVKDVLNLLAAAIKMAEALSDGVGLSDLGALFQLAKAAPAGVSAVKSGKILPELKDLSDDEKADLKAFVASNVDLPVAQSILDGAIDLADLLKL